MGGPPSFGVWSDGSNPSFLHWGPHDPVGSDVSCVYMAQSLSYQWTDTDCTSLKQYVCEGKQFLIYIADTVSNLGDNLFLSSEILAPWVIFCKYVLSPIKKENIIYFSIQNCLTNQVVILYKLFECII